jgi:hypothetical protein
VKSVSVVFAILAGLALSAAARAEEDIPAYRVLSCEKDCPKTVPARIVDAPVPAYPMHYEGYNGGFAEALVDVDFTVATDGTVKDAVVESLIGPQDFADRTLSAVRARRYQPATEGGQPVEENHRTRVIFSAPDIAPGGRMGIVAAYQNALVARPNLNFYERTVAAYELATLYYGSGDYLDARDAIRIATIEKGRYLDDRSVADAIRLRIRIEALTGEFAEAFAWFAILRNQGVDDSAERNAVQTLHTMIVGSDPLTADGRIPPDGQPVFWQHTLLRRAFEFHDIAGKLDSFELRCQRHGIRSAVSDKANWTIPASWSGCFINVSGAPGTKFAFVELTPAAGTMRPAAP